MDRISNSLLLLLLSITFNVCFSQYDYTIDFQTSDTTDLELYVRLRAYQDDPTAWHYYGPVTQAGSHQIILEDEPEYVDSSTYYHVEFGAYGVGSARSLTITEIIFYRGNNIADGEQYIANEAWTTCGSDIGTSGCCQVYFYLYSDRIEYQTSADPCNNLNDFDNDRVGSPTPQPTNKPSDTPTKQPSSVPSQTPTLIPSRAPSGIPSDAPSSVPTNPSAAPTIVPSIEPSYNPTIIPTMIPSSDPTMSPTNAPSRSPTQDNAILIPGDDSDGSGDSTNSDTNENSGDSGDNGDSGTANNTDDSDSGNNGNNGIASLLTTNNPLLLAIYGAIAFGICVMFIAICWCCRIKRRKRDMASAFGTSKLEVTVKSNSHRAIAKVRTMTYPTVQPAGANMHVTTDMNAEDSDSSSDMDAVDNLQDEGETVNIGPVSTKNSNNKRVESNLTVNLVAMGKNSKLQVQDIDSSVSNNNINNNNNNEAFGQMLSDAKLGSDMVMDDIIDDMENNNDNNGDEELLPGGNTVGGSNATPMGPTDAELDAVVANEVEMNEVGGELDIEMEKPMLFMEEGVAADGDGGSGGDGNIGTMHESDDEIIQEMNTRQ